MNNANAIALIETGTLSTEKMLELCEKADDMHGKEPRRSGVVYAFTRQWLASNSSATNIDFLNLISTASNSVQTSAVYVVANRWNKEDFDHALRVLSCRLEIYFAVVMAKNCTQEDIFSFSREFYTENAMTWIPHFWTLAINSGVMNAEGLHMVAMDKSYQNWFAYAWVQIQELAILVLSKKKLNAMQVMDICKKFDRFEVSMAAIKTGILSDDQILSLKSTARSVSEDFWGLVIPLLHLEDRTVSDLIALGEKANSDMLWPSITKAINSKKAVRA